MLGEFAVKIKDVIVEDVALDQRIERATKTWVDAWNKEVRENPSQAKDPQELQQFAMSLAKDSSGKQLFQPKMPTQQDLNAVPNYLKSVLTTVFSTQSARQTAEPDPAQEIGPSKFLQQFELISAADEPATIQYGNTAFQRNEDGNWIDFRSGKLAPDRFVRALDKISPPETEPAEQEPITVTGRSGEVYAYNDTTRSWTDHNGDVITDPTALAKLNQAALPQFQNRQMQAHTIGVK